jgi:ketosteroid isomerase-like protein
MDEPALAVPPDSCLEDARRKFEVALERGDARSAAEVYAADGRLLLPESRALDGRDSIEAFWRAGLDAGMSAITLQPESIQIDASFACEVGSYLLCTKPRHESPATDRGRYLIVHRVDPDGTWRRALEVFAPAGESG